MHAGWSMGLYPAVDVGSRLAKEDRTLHFQDCGVRDAEEPGQMEKCLNPALVDTW